MGEKLEPPPYPGLTTAGSKHRDVSTVSMQGASQGGMQGSMPGGTGMGYGGQLGGPLYPPAQMPSMPSGAYTTPSTTQAGGAQVQWMPAPAQVVPECPPGLECLAALDQLLVLQDVEILEALTGIETNNSYVVKNARRQKLFYAKEGVYAYMYSASILYMCPRVVGHYGLLYYFNPFFS